MVSHINPSKLQLDRASFLDLHLSTCISDGFVKTIIYNKRHGFDIAIVDFPFSRW